MQLLKIFYRMNLRGKQKVSWVMSTHYAQPIEQLMVKFQRPGCNLSIAFRFPFNHLENFPECLGEFDPKKMLLLGHLHYRRKITTCGS